jgi:hypothetical protein
VRVGTGSSQYAAEANIGLLSGPGRVATGEMITDPRATPPARHGLRLSTGGYEDDDRPCGIRCGAGASATLILIIRTSALAIPLALVLAGCDGEAACARNRR